MTTTYYEYAPAGDLIITVDSNRYRKNDGGDWANADTGEVLQLMDSTFWAIQGVADHANAVRQVEAWRKKDDEARKGVSNW